MASDRSDRATERGRFEVEADILAEQQLDLVAQLELQLTAVHQTMRHIGRLRNFKRRVGPEPSNGERADELVHLAKELQALDHHFDTLQLACQNMGYVVQTMQSRLKNLRQQPALQPPTPGRDTSQEAG